MSRTTIGVNTVTVRGYIVTTLLYYTIILYYCTMNSHLWPSCCSHLAYHSLLKSGKVLIPLAAFQVLKKSHGGRLSCNSQRDSCPNETLSNTCRRLIWRQIVLPSLKALRLNPQRLKHLIITLQATLIGTFQSKSSFSSMSADFTLVLCGLLLLLLCTLSLTLISSCTDRQFCGS